MKWLLLLMIPFTLTAQMSDTSFQMVYLYKDVIKSKKKHSLWLYTSYDLWWQDESGIGLTFTIPNKRKKKRYVR
jgi:hypothetical protein